MYKWQAVVCVHMIMWAVEKHPCPTICFCIIMWIHTCTTWHFVIKQSKNLENMGMWGFYSSIHVHSLCFCFVLGQYTCILYMFLLCFCLVHAHGTWFQVCSRTWPVHVTHIYCTCLYIVLVQYTCTLYMIVLCYVYSPVTVFPGCISLYLIFIPVYYYSSSLEWKSLRIVIRPINYVCSFIPGWRWHGKRSDGLWPGELIKDGSFSGNMHSIYAV